MYLNREYKYSKCIKYNVFKYCLALVANRYGYTQYLHCQRYIKMNQNLRKKTPNTTQLPSSCNSSLYIDKNIANPHSTFAPCFIQQGMNFHQKSFLGNNSSAVQGLNRKLQLNMLHQENRREKFQLHLFSFKLKCVKFKLKCVKFKLKYVKFK